eukprot:8248330-Karenia_brevis.AAC.1
MVNLRIRSAANPSDDPSRFVSLRSPRAPASWAEDLISPEDNSWSYFDEGSRLPNLHDRICCKVFAGEGGLSLALAQAGLA